MEALQKEASLELQSPLHDAVMAQMKGFVTHLQATIDHNPTMGESQAELQRCVQVAERYESVRVAAEAAEKANEVEADPDLDLLRQVEEEAAEVLQKADEKIGRLQRTILDFEADRDQVGCRVSVRDGKGSCVLSRAVRSFSGTKVYCRVRPLLSARDEADRSETRNRGEEGDAGQRGVCCLPGYL